jgi:spore maturation protein CgeB
MFVRLAPSLFTKIAPGPEPMLKNFEVAGSGCAAVCDDIPELMDLGFVDGDNIVLYRDFDELRDKLHHYLAHPHLLHSIGRRGSALCMSRHTWKHRAEQIRRILFRHILE